MKWLWVQSHTPTGVVASTTSCLVDVSGRIHPFATLSRPTIVDRDSFRSQVELWSVARAR
jgi:hypothetical protein